MGSCVGSGVERGDSTGDALAEEEDAPGRLMPIAAIRSSMRRFASALM